MLRETQAVPHGSGRWNKLDPSELSTEGLNLVKGKHMWGLSASSAHRRDE